MSKHVEVGGSKHTYVLKILPDTANKGISCGVVFLEDLSRNYYSIDRAKVLFFIEVYSKLKIYCQHVREITNLRQCLGQKKKNLNLICSVSAICQGHFI